MYWLYLQEDVACIAHNVIAEKIATGHSCHHENLKCPPPPHIIGSRAFQFGTFYCVKCVKNLGIGLLEICILSCANFVLLISHFHDSLLNSVLYEVGIMFS
jgi:hypothetical protein